MKLLLVLTVLHCVIAGGNGAKILGVSPYPGKSHYSVFEALLKKLAERGHEVVSITHFPQKKPLANFTDVDISSSMPSVISTMSFERFKGTTMIYDMKQFLYHCGHYQCEPILLHPEMQRIIKSKEKFDVYMVEVFGSECFLGIGHVLDIPVTVAMISSTALPWSNDMISNPDNPSYIPNIFGRFSDRMNLYERIQNLWHLLYTKYCYRYYSDSPNYRVAKKYLGDDLPDFDSLRSRVSMVLTNGHPVVSPPRAQTPAFKELGGIHIPPSGPSPLPKDLKDYLDGQGKDGVIYFSLGSQLNSSTMSEQAFAAFYKAFEQLPQQILWKCTKEKMPKLPRNVKCIEWAPQLSILCHPNVRLFITHVGLLGSQEAVYCGVPILGMPLFGDQHSNMAYFVKKGLGLELNYGELSYEAVLAALNELLTNKSYKEATQKASMQFKDRPIPPAEEGAYWVEYLIRHGPDSLKTEAVNLSWYQYLLLDVIAISAIAIVMVLTAVRTILKTTWFRHLFIYCVYIVLCTVTVVVKLVRVVYELSKNFYTVLYDCASVRIAQKKLAE
ncbi:UDP-glucosyltransferase 2 [Lasioglossum baleicum]|uniref:UDP-glucosyltransferase 2 n=1 Tax=Lasioglossum baleicum TaxID=434251 RepID=UPI003FCDB281